MWNDKLAAYKAGLKHLRSHWDELKTEVELRFYEDKFDHEVKLAKARNRINELEDELRTIFLRDNSGSQSEESTKIQ